MPEVVTLIVEAKVGKAKKEIKELNESIEEVAETSKKATKETKSLGEEVGESGAAISLLDAATGGLASRVRDVVEVYKQFRGRIASVTAAQIKANLAFLANPYVVFGAAITALVGSLGVLIKLSSDKGVPAFTTLRNIVLSLGDATKFTALQAEALAKNTKFITDRQIEQTERAIAVLQAFGENTTQIELENQERRLSLLKEGDEMYQEELTKLLVLRARRAKELGEAEATAYEKAKQEKIAELQLEEQLKAEAQAIEDSLAFEQGANDGIAYAEGFLKGKIEQQRIQETFAFIDEADIDIENDPELLRQVELGKALIKAEEEKNEKIKQAREDLFLNLASIFGAESRLGKAFIVAKQLEAATRLAIEAGITAGFISQEVARSKVALAVGVSKTASVGFPQNIPLLIGYAAQAAGIVAAIKAATSEAGIATATPAFVPAFPGVSPQIVQTLPNVSPVGRDSTSQLAEAIQSQQQRPIRAFVVSSDVTSAQELDRNIVEGASI